jgi:NADH:ubiquinone oxidoreductase subunit 4 (subunit M)
MTVLEFAVIAPLIVIMLYTGIYPKPFIDTVGTACIVAASAFFRLPSA